MDARVWKSFTDGQEGLELKGKRGWYAWSKSGQRPSDIPTNPGRAYRDDAWVSPTGSSALKEMSTAWWPRGLLFESVLILSPGILSPVVFFEACSGGYRTRDLKI